MQSLREIALRAVWFQLAASSGTGSTTGTGGTAQFAFKDSFIMGKEFLITKDLLGRLVSAGVLLMHDYDGKMILYQLPPLLDGQADITPVVDKQLNQQQRPLKRMKPTLSRPIGKDPLQQELNRLETTKKRFLDELRKLHILKSANDPVEHAKLTKSIHKWRLITQELALDLFEHCRSLSAKNSEAMGDSSGGWAPNWGWDENQSDHQNHHGSIESEELAEEPMHFREPERESSSIEGELTISRMLQAFNIDINLVGYDEATESFIK